MNEKVRRLWNRLEEARYQKEFHLKEAERFIKKESELLRQIEELESKAANG